MVKLSKGKQYFFAGKTASKSGAHREFSAIWLAEEGDSPAEVLSNISEEKRNDMGEAVLITAFNSIS